MRILPALTLSLLAAGATPASAQSGLNLFWGECQADGGLTETYFDCSTNSGVVLLVASVVIPADMPQFTQVQVIIDAYLADGTVPPWWQVASGQCRAGAVTATYDLTTRPPSDNCPAIWGGAVPLQVQQIQPEVRGPGMFRAVSAAAVPVGEEIPLLADGADRIVCQLRIMHTKSTGAGACEGCRTGACFCLTEVKLLQPVGLADYTVTTPLNQWATHNAWHGYGYPPLCTTPALNTTWGAIKSRYR